MASNIVKISNRNFVILNAPKWSLASKNKFKKSGPFGGGFTQN